MNSDPDPTWHRHPDASGLPARMPGAGCFIVLAFVAVCLLSLILPPLKSADEADHIRRAGFLLQGQVLAQVQRCAVSEAGCRAGRSLPGGMLDAGLRDYLVQNAPSQRQHESVLGRQRAAAVSWRGLAVFDVAPAAARVFPAVHAPLAAGLALGQGAGLNVDDSYRLARAFSLVAGLLVLVAAFRVYRPPAIVPGLLLLPAVLFQAASGSVDFLVTALALLVLACFLRVAALRAQAPVTLGLLMMLAVLLVGVSQVQLVPMLLLMFCAAWLSGQRLWWVLAVLATAGVAGWHSWVSVGLNHPAPDTEGAGVLAARYLQAPRELVRVMTATLGDRELLKSLLMGFIGRSGELSFPLMVYPALAAGLGVIWLCALASWSQWRAQWRARIALLLCAVLCGLCVFLQALAGLPFAPLAIEGVPGHRLLVPVALGLVAFSGWSALPLCGGRVLGGRAWSPGAGDCAVRKECSTRFGRLLASLRQLLLVSFAGVALLLSVQRLLTGYYLPQFPEEASGTASRQATAIEVDVPVPPALP